MIPHHIDAIEKAHIESLIENRRPESRNIEYKQKLPGKKPSERKEFLADVTSFANSEGGDIIYGIEEEQNSGEQTGIPKGVLPLDETTPDRAATRLASMIHDGSDPPVYVRTHPIQWDEAGKFLLVLRIHPSLNPPHMVITEGDRRFYLRHDTGKQPMNVDEIKQVTLATDAHAQRIQNFRRERYDAIKEGEVPVRLNSGQRAVLHIIPIGSYMRRRQADLTDQNTLRRTFQTFSGWGSAWRYNLDGWIVSAESSGKAEYCQLYRSGVIESVTDSFMTHDADLARECGITGYIASGTFEQELVDVFGRYLNKGLSAIDATGPFLLSFALLRCQNCVMHCGPGKFFDYRIGRETAEMPEVFIEDTGNLDVVHTIRDIIDGIWNACGYPGSPNHKTGQK